MVVPMTLTFSKNINLSCVEIERRQFSVCTVCYLADCLKKGIEKKAVSRL
jgi:hypothetical protein